MNKMCWVTQNFFRNCPKVLLKKIILFLASSFQLPKVAPQRGYQGLFSKKQTYSTYQKWWEIETDTIKKIVTLQAECIQNFSFNESNFVLYSVIYIYFLFFSVRAPSPTEREWVPLADPSNAIPTCKYYNYLYDIS